VCLRLNCGSFVELWVWVEIGILGKIVGHG
jgi:hypothetical protein